MCQIIGYAPGPAASDDLGRSAESVHVWFHLTYYPTFQCKCSGLEGRFEKCHNLHRNPGNLHRAFKHTAPCKRRVQRLRSSLKDFAAVRDEDVRLLADSWEIGKGGMRKGGIGKSSLFVFVCCVFLFTCPIPPFLIPPFPISRDSHFSVGASKKKTAESLQHI